MAKAQPVRLCLGCREPKIKSEMLRVVRTGEGTIQIDLKGKISGRGAYVCKNRACIEKVIRSKALDRALGVSVSADITDSLNSFFN